MQLQCFSAFHRCFSKGNRAVFGLSQFGWSLDLGLADSGVLNVSLDLALESNDSVTYFCLLDCKTWMPWVYGQGTLVSLQIKYITVTIVWTCSNNIWRLKSSSTSILSNISIVLSFKTCNAVLKCGTFIQNVLFQANDLLTLRAQSPELYLYKYKCISCECMCKYINVYALVLLFKYCMKERNVVSQI